jgi:alkanesulfonate monooxygenase SsuD/methylene tetrahydromethanopterin reductase-like flavin-dependent oxidoreductase (luciferase family)
MSPLATLKDYLREKEETFALIKALWSNERSASFEGKYYNIKDAICNPKPIQRPHPIIMVGGSGEKYSLKVAASISCQSFIWPPCCFSVL